MADQFQNLFLGNLSDVPLFKDLMASGQNEPITIQILLQSENEITRVIFPIAPSKIEVDVPNKNDTEYLLDRGEINIVKPGGLKNISFTALLPEAEYPFAQYDYDGYRPPEFYLNFFNKLKEEAHYFQLWGGKMLSNRWLNFMNVMATLEDFTVKREAEQGMDVLVDLKFKEYKYYSTIHNPVGTRMVKSFMKTYVVKAGENLYDICQKVLGDGTVYKDVADNNQIKNPAMLQEGQVINFEINITST